MKDETKKKEENNVKVVNVTVDEKKMFDVIPQQIRKQISLKFGMDFVKPVSFGKQKELEKPRRLYRVRGDGNCYFRAVSYIFTGTQDNHNILRSKLVSHMKKIDKQLQNYLDRNVDEYLDDSRMIDDGVWATDAEIFATANLLNVDIHVHTGTGWWTYPAGFSNYKKAGFNIYLQNLSDHYIVVLSV